MTHLLPGHLLKHFQARPAIPYIRPLGRDPAEPLGLLGSRTQKEKAFVGVFDCLEDLRSQALFQTAANGVKLDEDDQAPLASATNGLEDEKAAIKAEEQGEADAMKVDEDAAAVAAPVKSQPTEEGELGEVEDAKPSEQPESSTTRLKQTVKALTMQQEIAAADETELERLCQTRAGVPDEHGFTLTGEDAFQIRSAARKRRKAMADKRQAETYDPNTDRNASGDPYKTLFLSRLHPDVTEDDLRKEFDMYGRIDKITLVRDKHGKSRKYGFILYERERDMKAAYKDAEGIKIKGKRILVDVERGRTVKGWKPMRLGGGLGGRPKPVEKGAAFGSGFRGRGGFRGGFSSRGGGFRGGFGGPPRGGYAGPSSDRGFDNRGPPGGAFDSRGPPGGGFDRNGPPQNDRGGGFSSRGGYGPPPGAQSRGFDQPRGGGIGFDGQRRDGWNGGQDGGRTSAFGSSSGSMGPPKREFGNDSYGDRDSKRPRY